jgi:succinyl-diaminopimelate desuccinylase
MTALSAELAAATLRLVATASESRHEEAVVEAVRAELDAAPGLRIVEDRDTVLVALPAKRREVPLVVLAGHMDTVPAAGARSPGLGEDGTVHGRGAADMKGGLAVMLRLAADRAADSDIDLGFVFFGREEVPISESALLPAFQRCRELRDASLAIVLEPTANELEVGCNGNLNAILRITGRAAHSARPWLGANAIHAGIEALAPASRATSCPIASRPPSICGTRRATRRPRPRRACTSCSTTGGLRSRSSGTPRRARSVWTIRW